MFVTGRGHHAQSLVVCVWGLRRVFPFANLSVCWLVCVGQAKEREEESRRRHKRRVDDYLDLLIDYYYRDDHINVTWEEVRASQDSF